MAIEKLDLASFPGWAEKLRRPFQDHYFAMYSSVFGGIVTDPVLMLVPIDDHMVHRGDGVFETFKCINGCIYNLQAHLDRLENSARELGFVLPCAMIGLRDVVLETVRAGGRRDCLVRLLVSRGPGSFGVSPYECPEVQVYVAVTALKRPFMELHPAGAKLKTSSIAAKPAFYAGIKNCNYLPNVLMAKEAADAHVDFVAAYDDRGFLAEGATENVGIVTRDHRLLFPELGGILRGTTMMRVAELARALVDDGTLREVAFRRVTRDEVHAAPEILVVGTTPNVTCACEYDGRKVGDGSPGPVYAALSRLLLDDIASNHALQTPVF